MVSGNMLSSFEVCGLEDVPSVAGGRHASLLSIVDPDICDVFRPSTIPVACHLVMRFHDLIEPDRSRIAPEEPDVAAILEFGRRRGEVEGTAMLIHCHMGISRSTAALAILLAQSDPDRLTDVFPKVVALRPQAWPNSRMIGMADTLLGLNGRLMMSLRHLYRHQMIYRPDVVDIIRRYDRVAEIGWALFGGVSPREWEARRTTGFERRIRRVVHGGELQGRPPRVSRR